MWPFEAALQAKTLERVRSALPVSACEAAWSEGRAPTAVAAIDRALGLLVD